MYFLYPETCGVRLEDMDALFGDATGAAGTPASTTPTATPALRAESDALLRAASPVPGLDGRVPTAARFGAASSAIPGLAIDPPADVEDGKPQAPTRRPVDAQQGSGLSGWFSRIMGRGRAGGPSSGGQYAPLDQRED